MGGRTVLSGCQIYVLSHLSYRPLEEELRMKNMKDNTLGGKHLPGFGSSGPFSYRNSFSGCWGWNPGSVCTRQMLCYGAMSPNLSSGLLPFLSSLFLSIKKEKVTFLRLPQKSFQCKLPVGFLDEQDEAACIPVLLQPCPSLLSGRTS